MELTKVHNAGAQSETTNNESNPYLHAIEVLRSKTVVIIGRESTTIESEEMNRKKALHEQLKLARRLRALMEQGAKEAEESSTKEEAYAILMKNKSHINQLVALTEAVRGKDVLSSYNFYNARDREKRKKKEREKLIARKLVLSQLHSWKKERNPSVPFIENETPVTTDESNYTSEESDLSVHLESENDDTDDSETLANFNRSRLKRSCTSIYNREKYLYNEEESQEPLDEGYMQEYNLGTGMAPGKANKSKKNKTKNAHLHSQKKVRKAASSTDILQSVEKTKKIDNEVSDQKIVGQEASSKTAGISPGQHEKGNVYTNVSGKKVVAQGEIKYVASKPTSQTKKPRNRVGPQVRKCHDCKLSSDCFVRCNFFFDNGNKCGKAFCRKCLTDKYNLLDFDSALLDSEWHCPSCLGNCQCSVCVRTRERNERLAAASSDRRSTSRTTAGTFYFL